VGSGKARGEYKDDKRKSTGKAPLIGKKTNLMQKVSGMLAFQAPPKPEAPVEAAPAARGPVKTPEDKKNPKVSVTDKTKADPKSASFKQPGSKKGKNDAKDEDDSMEYLEPMFESNGIFYILGNRSLNSLNLCANGITDVGVKHLLDAINEQEQTAVEGADSKGAFRISLQVIILYNSSTTSRPTQLTSRN
jgi:hypothetical protein